MIWPLDVTYVVPTQFNRCFYCNQRTSPQEAIAIIREADDLFAFVSRPFCLKHLWEQSWRY